MDRCPGVDHLHFAYRISGEDPNFRKTTIMLAIRLLLSLLIVSPFLPAQSFQAGASQSAINPSVGSFIAGHTHNRRFSGMHDSLYAKALAISSEKSGIVFLSIDCIGLLYPQLEAIRKEVTDILGGSDVPNIILSSTHTHAGPDVVGIWGEDMMHSGVDSSYLGLLVHKASVQVANAWRQRKPVSITFSQKQAGQDWVYNISQSGELDRSVTSIFFRDPTGKMVASMTNFACHPTFVDAVHDRISSDYLSGFYKHLDSVWGGVNLFLQGPIGGWVQPEYEAKTFEQAEFRGRQLADTVVAGYGSSVSLKGNRVSFKSRTFELPVTNPGFQQLSELGVIKRQMAGSVRTEIAWVNIGNATIATHPGESVPAMGIATKALMHNDGPRMVLGLSMDALGYILKPEFFDPSNKIPHSEYLCSMSTGKETAPKVMQVIGELADQKEE